MKYGYIFDFDGVLANTMDVHYKCYKMALEEYGVPIDKEKFYHQAGMTAIEQIQYFCDKAGVSTDPYEIYQRKREIAKQFEGEGSPIDVNIRLFSILKNAGIGVAIASGSSRPSILPIVKRFNIPADVIVTAEDVKRGKPNPDLFLTAAQRLGIAPENCVVIEDSQVGVEAAANAGMSSMRFVHHIDIERKDSGAL